MPEEQGDADDTSDARGLAASLERFLGNISTTASCTTVQLPVVLQLGLALEQRASAVLPNERKGKAVYLNSY